MKLKNILFSGLAIIALAGTMPLQHYDTVSAYTQTSMLLDGIEYTITENNEISIVGNTGVLPENLVIPSEIDGLPVTSIGIYAFEFASITSLTIPDSVKIIDEGAFYGCNLITSLNLGNGVENIGTGAFHSCSSLETIVFPESLKSIGAYSFAFCLNFSDITIGNNTESIGEAAFYACENLVKVTIPRSVTQIGEVAFGYVNYDGTSFYKTENPFTIAGYPSSSAEEYAAMHEFSFEPISLTGDVNCDGKISILDVITLKNIILNDESYIISADLNSDEKISVLDLIEIKNLILAD